MKDAKDAQDAHANPGTTGPELEWAGERLVVLPAPALWWPREQTLFVADLHLGKGDVFRASGIPIPSGTTRDDLSRLGRIVRGIGARRLVVLGDFFHGAASQSEPVHRRLEGWRSDHPDVPVLLVRGNHDRHAGDPPEALGIQVRSGPVRLGPFLLRHEPTGVPGPGSSDVPAPVPAGGAGFELAGHLHPAVRLQGPGRERLKLPCFWFRPRGGVLPAFGAFTGTARIHPGGGDRVFVVAGDSVLEVPVTDGAPPE